jgi:hypothetical protein
VELMAILSIFVLIMLQMCAIYFLIEEMKSEVRDSVRKDVDEFMRTVHFRSLSEVNKLGMMSDSKKLEQIENIIIRLERVVEK